VNIYFSFLFLYFILYFFYIFVTIHFTNVVLMERLEVFLYDKIWKAWNLSFVNEIWTIYL